ncbi:MAG: hypothetical protein AB7L92_08205 [Alphaproteobacteria bacterium]
MGKKRDNDDDRDYLQKVKESGMRDLDDKDYIDAVADGSTIFPGAIGDVAAAPLKAWSGSISGARDYQKYSEKLGVNLHAEAMDPANRALRRDIGEMEGRSGKNFEQYGSMGVGAMAGQAVGSAIIPIPLVGTVAGAWAGSSLGSAVYDEVAKDQDQDTMGLINQMNGMRQQGQRIPPEMVFAGLAANLPDEQENDVLNRLEALTGTRKFSDALAQGKTLAVAQVMRDYDHHVRTDVQHNAVIPFDQADAKRTVSEQLADAINNGQMDPLAIGVRRTMPKAMQFLAQQQQVQSQAGPLMPQPAHQNSYQLQTLAQQTQQPRMAMHNPELAGIAADMSKMGITPALDENGKLVLLPNKNKQPPGKA